MFSLFADTVSFMVANQIRMLQQKLLWTKELSSVSLSCRNAHPSLTENSQTQIMRTERWTLELSNPKTLFGQNVKHCPINYCPALLNLKCNKNISHLFLIITNILQTILESPSCLLENAVHFLMFSFLIGRRRLVVCFVFSISCLDYLEICLTYLFLIWQV